MIASKSDLLHALCKPYHGTVSIFLDLGLSLFICVLSLPVYLSPFLGFFSLSVWLPSRFFLFSYSSFLSFLTIFALFDWYLNVSPDISQFKEHYLSDGGMACFNFFLFLKLIVNILNWHNPSWGTPSPYFGIDLKFYDYFEGQIVRLQAQKITEKEEV